MKNQKGYEYFARLMNDYGTTHCFYQEVTLRRVLKEAEERYGIKGIMAHSEIAAGYMADGYARASGKVGFCGAQSIGAANLAAGLSDAWLGLSPVVAVTGKKTPEFQYRSSYQEADHERLFSGVTKFQAEVVDPQQLPRLLRMCYQEATSGKPRPAHLDLIGINCCDAEEADIAESCYTYAKHYPAARGMADSESVAEAAALLNSAKRPIIVVGRGAFISRAGEAILRLMRRGNLPAVTTPDGKTVLDEYHPLWMGICGNYGMSCANSALEEADLVLFIGTQTADQSTCNWSCPPPSVKNIQIDVCSEEFGKNYPDCVGLLGDAAPVCLQLEEAMRPNENERAEWLKRLANARDEVLRKQRVQPAEKLVPTARLCEALTRVLPRDAALISDTGYSAIWTANYVRVKTSNTYIRAAGSLGWSYPASLGVKCALPGRPVVCFTGDGGFYYYLSEMETAVRCGINTVTIVNNNRILNQCVPDMRVIYGTEHEEDKLRFTDVSFANVARAFGVWAKTVERTEDVAPVIEEALALKAPALVEVMTDGARPMPPH